MNLPFQNTLNVFSTKYNKDLKAPIRSALTHLGKTIIVLDDDPTGTQTMYDIPVLTSWEKDVLRNEFDRATPLFYILTNSRSLTASKANSLNKQIGENIKAVADESQSKYIIISRGDSTLRGHYPNETDALTEGLQLKNYHTAIIPAFFEGGRFTIDDIHYVKENDTLVPVAETPFAQDKTFGFTKSNLKDWVEEKTKGNINHQEVCSYSLKDLREQSIAELIYKLENLPAKSTIIVNATNEHDLQKFALAYLQTDVQILFRTAASFVKAISGKEDKDLLNVADLGIDDNSSNGGLIVVGSYVPKTTQQLQLLLQNQQLQKIELQVPEILKDSVNPTNVANNINELLLNGKNVLLYTSRDLQTGADEEKSLAIANKVAYFISSVTQQITTPPKFIIAKGGITSSDMATKSLQMKRAKVLGQILPGVPVWKAGNESKFPGIPFIIFPGNVGESDALVSLYHKINETN